MIYTTYFAQLRNLPENIIPISICAFPPKWYKGIQYKKIAPKQELLLKYKEDGDVAFYKAQYKKDIIDKITAMSVLSDLTLALPKEIRMKLDRPLHRSKDIHVALVCFEKSEDFCHRHLVSEWLNGYGIKCEEWKKNENS